jgi:hypothetical protein
MEDQKENVKNKKTIGQRIAQIIFYLFMLLILATVVMAAYRKYTGT